MNESTQPNETAGAPGEHHPGRVQRVRLYVDRADVTRVRRLACGPGCAEVALGPLPLGLVPPTLRAQVWLEPAGRPGERLPLAVSGLASEVVYRAPPAGRRQAVEENLQRLDGELQALEDQQSTERYVQRALNSYARLTTSTLSRAWLDRDPAFDKWSESLDALRARTERIAARSAAREEERKSRLEAKARLLQEVRAVARGEKQGYRLTITFAEPTPTAGALLLELSYVTHEAQWMPSYDLRCAGEVGAERVELSSVALVRQRTGEDWEDVELVATTARPRLAEPPPDLARLVVAGAARRRGGHAVLAPPGAPRTRGVAGRPVGEVQVEHAAPGRVSVPSSGRPSRVVLFTAELAASTRLELAPALQRSVVRVAEVENGSTQVLLPGTVNLFVGDRFVGQTQLGFIQPGERFRLALGTEGGVRVVHDMREEPESSTILGERWRSYRTRTRLENLRAEPLRLLIRERVPVSRTESAMVKVDHLEQGAHLDPKTGLCLIEVVLGPRGQRELELAYRVGARRDARVDAHARA